METRLIDFHLKPETLSRFGLPDRPYSIPKELFLEAVSTNGDVAFEVLLYGLQLKSADACDEWLELEPAQNRLVELLGRHNENDSITAAGDTWWLEVGPVDLDSKLIAIHRGECLIAAIAPRDDGRLRVAAYRPLDAESIQQLIALGQKPHPEYGVCMRENNWEYALDASAGMGQVYAASAGRAHLAYWEFGVGIFNGGAESPEYRPLANSQPRRSESVVQEIGAFYSLAPEYET